MSGPDFLVHSTEDTVGVVVVETVKAGNDLTGLIMDKDESVTIKAIDDIPLGHKDAAYVRSHFDAMEVRVNDAPRANEILVAVCVTDSGRPLPRVGGLTHEDAEGKDGLR